MKLAANSIYNVDALSLFEKIEDSSFDLVYLDPPWHENQFDKEDDNSEYEEYFFKIIQQAYRILKSSGHLFYYIRPTDIFSVQSLIEPVFSKGAFRIQFIIPNKTYLPNKLKIGHDYESLLLYSKSYDSPIYPIVNFQAADEVKKRFNLLDERGYFRSDTLFSPYPRPSLDFDWEGFRPPKGQGWRFTREKLEQLKQEGRIYYSSNISTPRLKRYYSEDALPLIGSIWDDIPISDPSMKKQWSGAQSIKFVERILQLGTKEGDWVIDPFCGTGPCLLAASHLKRNWVGNDSSDIALDICISRLKKNGIGFHIEALQEDDEIIWDQYLPFRATEEELLKKEIEKGESQRLEFKESLKWNYHTNSEEKGLVNKIIKEIAGFMNSKFGGKLLIGVQDDGKIIDLKMDFSIVNSQKKNIDGYHLFLSEKIKEILGPEAINFFEIEFPVIDSKVICVIKISPSSKPIFFEKEFYVRNITQTMKLTAQDACEYLSEKNIRK